MKLTTQPHNIWPISPIGYSIHVHSITYNLSLPKAPMRSINYYYPKRSYWFPTFMTKSNGISIGWRTTTSECLKIQTYTHNIAASPYWHAVPYKCALKRIANPVSPTHTHIPISLYFTPPHFTSIAYMYLHTCTSTLIHTEVHVCGEWSAGECR